MVLLGGLEFVAAGYVINELHKSDKKEVSKERRGSRDRKDHHRKHSHRRHDSPHRPRPQQRPPNQQQGGLRPPQVGPPRPYSAPPPGSHPMWQPQPFQGQPQQWQPHPVAFYPPQQPPVQYHPPPQIQNHPAPKPAINPSYPPAGTYIDMKTGKVQHSLYPPGEDPFSRQRSVDAERTRGEDQAYPDDRSTARSQTFQPDGGQHDRSLYSQSQMNIQPVPSPWPGYAELDSETPGRFRPHDEKRPYIEERHSPSPPPSYRE